MQKFLESDLLDDQVDDLIFCIEGKDQRPFGNHN